MNRYFLHLAYNGSSFSGWQIQPNAPTVQNEIEQVLRRLYDQDIKVVGCGRTDAGVHAYDFYAHLDLPDERIKASELSFKLNNMLPASIVIYDFIKVNDTAHARFDAESRSYVYKMTFAKDPFNVKTSYRYDQSGRPDFNSMNDAAQILLDYKEFYPFCKSHADVDTYKCKISKSVWEKISENEWHYHVKADRFLRGMVRLIVGMTLNVGLGRVEKQSVIEAMNKQERLSRAWSVPADGLYLNKITYPYIL